MPPLTKTCPKTVLTQKGGSLSVEGVFAKNFLRAGEDSAAYVSTAVTRLSPR
jgi:hypothetical protein